MDKVAGGSIIMLYAYMFVMFLVALYMVYRSEAAYKFELFFVAFYLLTGTINELLTFAPPGISFFEIQPPRALFLVFLFLFVRRLIFPYVKKERELKGNLPWFLISFNVMVVSVVIALLTHVEVLGVKDMLGEIQKPLNMLLILYGMYLISDEGAIETMGKVIILAAVVSSVASLIQVSVEPSFLRYGEQRPAFGSILRSNGIFETERLNGFFLLTGMAWMLVADNTSKLRKYLLTAVIAAGVLCTFHRMSWLMLSMVLLIYFTRIDKIPLDRLAFAGLLGLTLMTSVLIFSWDEIKNSTVYQERINDSIGGRGGYFKVALNNIGDRPVFGFGGKNNEAYFEGMMKATGNMKRARAEEGGFHSGYFSMMFYYGLPAFISYTAFVILVAVYFGRLTSHHLFFAIPFCMSILYGVGNMTNTNLFQAGGLIFVIHIGMGLAARRMRKYFNRQDALTLNKQG